MFQWGGEGGRVVFRMRGIGFDGVGFRKKL